MVSSIYSPTTGCDFDPSLKLNQRYRHPFGDKRLANQYEVFDFELTSNQTSVIQNLGKKHTDVTNFYRFLHNPYVELDELIYQSTRINPAIIKDRNILAIIDESIISILGLFLTKDDLIENLGIGANNFGVGTHCVPCLLMDADSGAILGLAEILMFKVPKASKDSEQNTKNQQLRSKNLDFADRSSSFWNVVKKNAMLHLKEAKSVLFIMDQGAFFAENLLTMTKEGLEQGEFLTRANLSTNRQIRNSLGETEMFFDFLESAACVDTQMKDIKALNHYSSTKKKRKTRQARKGILKLKFGTFSILPTASCSKSYPTDAQQIYYVDVEEDMSTVPENESPIHWCLVSNRPINTIEQAWQLVDHYQSRWFIEQLFRILKNQGFDIEHTHLRDAEAIKKLVVMTLKSSVDALQLVSSRDNLDLPIETQFNEEEQALLNVLNDTLEGRTEKQRNPFPKKSLAYGSWIIARLTGHSGYSYHKPPGPIIMTVGLEKFRYACWVNSAIIKNSE